MTLLVQPTRPTWIEIDAQALANNVRLLRNLIGPNRQLMAVVKANGYGHGAVDVARLAIAAGADRLAVATASEGIELRTSGIPAPILVLGYTPPKTVASAQHHHITTTLFDLENARAIDAAAPQAGQTVTVHVKVNTGMNRLGIDPAEAVEFFGALRTLRHLSVEGVYTHFATSDETDKRHALEQFAVFHRVLTRLEQAGLHPPIAHAANSAALLTMPETHLDMARSGIAIYGLHPDVDQTRLPTDFRPVLSWKAQIAQVRELAPGDAVSYGREFIADRDMTIGVIPVGYADGFPRRPRHWNSVLIRGQQAPILGRVCMDQTIVDLSAIVTASGPVQQGEEVVLIGRQRGAELSAEEVGERLGTINYDVVSRILARVPRVVVNR